jgi:hypothetical protein
MAAHTAALRTARLSATLMMLSDTQKSATMLVCWPGFAASRSLRKFSSATMKKWLSQSYFESEAEYKQIQSYAQQVSKTLGTLASQPEALFKMLNGIRTDSKLGKNPFEVAAVELRREFYSFNKEMMQNATIGLYGTTASPMLDKTTAFIEALYRLTETAAQQTETGRKASQIMAGKQASEIEAALLQLVGNTAISQAAKLRTAFVETLRKLGAGIDREFARSIKK